MRKLIEVYNAFADKREALWVIEHVTGMQKLAILTSLQDAEMSEQQYEACMGIANQRKQNKPLSKIFGFKWFCGHKFFVNEYVLDPRPETEQIVDMIEKAENVLDLGTGSGCLIVSLVRKLGCKGVAVDISKQALEVAKQNAIGLDIEFMQSNWFENVVGKFDVIVSNPPYIATWEEVGSEVMYDPKLALYAEKDGFAAYEQIISQAGDFLTKDGSLILELPVRLECRLTEHARLCGFEVQFMSSSVDNISFGKLVLQN